MYSKQLEQPNTATNIIMGKGVCDGQYLKSSQERVHGVDRNDYWQNCKP